MGTTSFAMNNLYNNPQLLGAMIPGINVQAIQSAFQTQQVMAEQPLSLLSQQLSTLSAPVQAWQALQSDLQSLQTDAASLGGPTLYQGLTASSSDSTAVSATASGTGSGGTYTIAPASGQSAIVLAQDEIVNSASQSSDTSALNLSGSFSVDGTTVKVSSSDTLQAVAQAINAAGAGVSAVVLAPPGGGYVLSIQGAKAGPVSFTDPNGILGSLGVLNGGSPNVVQNYQYAQYSVNGANVTQGTANTDSTSIPGVGFTLLDTAGATLTVSQNTGAIQSTVQQFASDFNRYLSDVQKYTGKGGVLEGDGTIGAINAQIFQALDSAVPGQPSSLSALSQAGVSLTAPVGSPQQFTMSVDASTLQSALASNPNAFASLWNGSSGIGTQLNSLLSSSLSVNGGVTQAISNLTQQQSNLESQIGDPNSAVNQMVNSQLQGLQTKFDNLMQSLVALSGQSSMITQYVNMLSGQSGSGSSSSVLG